MDPIRAAAIRALYAQMRAGALSAVIITGYMVATAVPFTPWAVIAGWVAVTAVVQVLRWVLIHAWHNRKPEDAALEPWARIYVAYQALAGTVWGATMFVFAHPGQPITVALTLCCLYAITSGSLPALSYTPAAAYALLGTTFAAVLIRLLATGTGVYYVLGIASALFGLMMVAFTRGQKRTLDEGFRIRFENQALVAALTAQKNAAEEARRQAEHASLAKSQFLAAASHDLRQPLYALSLFSASLDTLRLDDEGRRVVGNIQESVAVMESLFVGLLDLSKLEAGVVQPRVGRVSIDALFDRLSQYFRPVALERGLDLRFRSDGEWVASDETLLEQVLSNLVSNALRYTAAGGVLVAARARRGTVRLEVWDTGPGIDERDRQRIFDEFVQIDNSERDRRKGLGLGLSIARRAAMLLGGGVALASRPGRGSRFSLTQPAIARPSSPPGVGPPDRGHAQSLSLALSGRDRSLPVLIVEDDRDVRAALSNLLARWNVRFEAVAGADAALHRLEEGAAYALVLSDYRLAGEQNGLDLIAAILARHAPPAPAAVLITGDLSPALMAAADQRGIPLLLKPVDPGLLRTLLEAHTGEPLPAFPIAQRCDPSAGT